MEGALQLCVFFFFNWRKKSWKQTRMAYMRKWSRGRMIPCGVKRINFKGPNFKRFQFWSNVSVFSHVGGKLEEIKGKRAIAWALSFRAGFLVPERWLSLMAYCWCFHANPYLTAFMMMIFLSVIIIKRFYLQITLLPFYPLSKAPQIMLLSVLCLVSDYHKAFDRIHCLLKKKRKKSNPSSCCILLVEYQDETICQKAAKSLPFPCNYECWVERCKLKPFCTLTLQSNCLIKLVFPPERYINKWTVEQIKNT